MKTEDGTSIFDLMDERIVDFSASKTKTLKKIARNLHCRVDDMLFFDDKEGRIEEGVRAGVTSIHCPDGLTWERFVTGVREFNARRRRSDEQTLILVRHGQGRHNVDDDWSIIDPADQKGSRTGTWTPRL